MAQRLRVLEMFAGIGGCAAAIGAQADIVAAVESDHEALAVYRHNFANPTCDQPVESLPTEWFRDCAAEVWWISPPVLPYVSAGLRREVDDPRSKGLLHAFEQVQTIKPRYIALECVPNFDKSLTRQLLLETLTESGYQCQETLFCPTELGISNQRRRYYLVAGLEELQAWKPKSATPQFAIRDMLDAAPHDELVIAPELLAMHRGTMHVVDAVDATAVSSCFTSDYGRSVNKTGSYLRDAGGLRYFSPAEMLRQLGFPQTFALPKSTSCAMAWRLVGNSLSIPAAQYILDAIPGLITRPPRFINAATRVQ